MAHMVQNCLFNQNLELNVAGYDSDVGLSFFADKQVECMDCYVFMFLQHVANMSIFRIDQKIGF